MFLLLITFLVFNGLMADENFEQVLEMIQNNIKLTDNFTLPTDNSEFFQKISVPAKIKDYGQYDFIIVGAGTAGSILTYELSKIKRLKFLVLEAGGPSTNFSHIPGMAIYTLKSPMNWGYLTSPQPHMCRAMANKQCLFSRGKTVGGSGQINFLIYTEGTLKDYESWPGWSLNEITDTFRQLETILPNNITKPESGFAETIYEGLKDKMNTKKVSYLINGNRRESGADLLKKVGDNVDILVNSLVTKILIDQNRRAFGVEFVRNGQYFRALAKSEVILSAGAINSPQVLLQSGIGPKNDLEKLSIKVIADLPVGKNLIEHPNFIGFNVRTNLTNPNLTIEEALKVYLTKGDRPLGSPVQGDYILFNRNTTMEYMSLPSTPPDNMTKFVYNLDQDAYKYWQTLNPTTDFTVIMFLQHPMSRGSVTLKSKSPLDYPNIDLQCYANPKDLDAMYEALDFWLNLMETKVFKEIGATVMAPQNLCGQYPYKSKPYWLCVIQALTIPGYHPMGTTRMGNCPENSVVDGDLRVHSINGLRVVDAGVIPNTISGHLNGPTFMLALRTANKMREELEP